MVSNVPTKGRLNKLFNKLDKGRTRWKASRRHSFVVFWLTSSLIVSSHWRPTLEAPPSVAPIVLVSQRAHFNNTARAFVLIYLFSPYGLAKLRALRSFSFRSPVRDANGAGAIEIWRPPKERGERWLVPALTSLAIPRRQGRPLFTCSYLESSHWSNLVRPAIRPFSWDWLSLG